MEPEQAAFLLQEVFLPNLKNEHRLTKSVIQAIPLDKGDYRPDTISKSALDLAWHIVATEMRFLNAVAAGGFDFTPMPRPESIKNSADLAGWYADNFASHLETVAKLSNEQLIKIVEHHTVHHRGQLSTYLRPMGAKVPAIYGESYDSAEARKAAQKGA
jgi:uncharacterized damage-inducible protein DinB